MNKRKLIFTLKNVVLLNQLAIIIYHKVIFR